MVIKAGLIKAGTKLPGSRKLAEVLEVHRQTVVLAMDELLAQGWIEVRPSSGTYVSGHLPEIKSKPLESESDDQGFSFSFNDHKGLTRKDSIVTELNIDEGVPDIRISPVEEIRRIYRTILSREFGGKLINYGSPHGDGELRETLTQYLLETRGLSFDTDQILITRGSQMGIYLASQLLLDSTKTVVVGALNYIATNLTFQMCRAQIIEIPTDDQGIIIDELESLCKRQKVDVVYVTPHHHHPTTVTLSADRRVRLVELSNRYHFAVLEDDYDYDFHYQHSPTLPLASAGNASNVIYIGGISKLVAPGLRVGYLIGPAEFIAAAARLRRIIDRQGDLVMERTISQLIRQGDIQRHARKALNLYTSRRNQFVEGLKESGKFTFKIPEGGMAVWTRLNDEISWKQLSDYLLTKKVGIPRWENYDPGDTGHNYNRLGFASLNQEEQERFFKAIAEVI